MKRRGIISRRRFLAGAALATALPACRTQPQSTRLSTGSAVHVGVIGCGRRGTELIADLMRRPGAHVVAVCDVFQPHKRRAHALSHARAHHHWEELIVASDVDAVVIATPDHWHGPMALAAMDAGKDVYCEPPLTQRVDQAVAVRNRAAATGRIVQVGARRTFERKWITARELIASGEIGEVTWCQDACPPQPTENPSIGAAASPAILDWEAFLGDAPRVPFLPERFHQWRHYWDYALGLPSDTWYEHLAAFGVALGGGEPAKVSAVGGVFATGARETPDGFVATIEYSGKRTIVLTSDPDGGPWRPPIIRGREGVLHLLGDRVRTMSHRGRHKDVLVAEPDLDPMQDWLDAMRSRRPCFLGERTPFEAMIGVSLAVDAYRQVDTLLWPARA